MGRLKLSTNTIFSATFRMIPKYKGGHMSMPHDCATCRPWNSAPIQSPKQLAFIPAAAQVSPHTAPRQPNLLPLTEKAKQFESLHLTNYNSEMQRLWPNLKEATQNTKCWQIFLLVIWIKPHILLWPCHLSTVIPNDTVKVFCNHTVTPSPSWSLFREQLLESI